MAARKRTWVDPKTREKIKTTKLLQRLQGFVLGEVEPNGSKDEEGNPRKIELSASQVKGIEILLRKNLPDLTSADIQVTQDSPVSQEEVFDRLVTAVGKEKALMLAPDFKRTIN